MKNGYSFVHFDDFWVMVFFKDSLSVWLVVVFLQKKFGRPFN